MNKIIPFNKALAILAVSIAIVSSVSYLFFSYIQHMRWKHRSDPKFNIVAIAQACGERESLKTSYLAELLDLSIDQPQNLYRFNLEDAKQKLQNSSLIKDPSLTKVKPGTLFIEYRLRTPVAFLGDFSNTAIDAEGTLIPFKPFFTPKKLPEIFIGLTSFGESAKEGDEDSGRWGRKLQGARAELALKLLRLVQKKCCSEAVSLLRIDVSKAYALSYGQREVVVILEEKVPAHAALVISPRTLRLSSERYMQELANYMAIRNFLNNRIQNPKGEQGVVKSSPVIIDLRAPRLAYLSEV